MKKNGVMKFLLLGVVFAMTMQLLACGASSAPASSEEEAVAEEVTEEPTAEPTEEPTPEPTEEPTEEPTPEPTEEPTEEPTPEPTEEAEAESSEAPAGEATDVASAALSLGAFTVDGDLFKLGESFSVLQGGNWKLTDEDAEKYADYTLNPWTTSGSAMGVYSDAYGQEFESFHVMISVMNPSDDPVAYLDGIIDYISMPGLNRVETLPEVILPGGLTLQSTEDDFRAAYGEPTYEYEDEETQFRSVKFEDGEVEIDVTWSKGSISEITMTI